MLYERSNEQLLSQKTLYIAHYKQKVSENAMLKRIFPCTDQQAFTKVIVLKSSTNVALRSVFCRVPCTWHSTNKKSGEMQCLSKLFQVLEKLISNTFQKYHFGSALLKEQCTAPFVECHVFNLPSAKNQHKCNA